MEKIKFQFKLRMIDYRKIIRIPLKMVGNFKEDFVDVYKRQDYIVNYFRAIKMPASRITTNFQALFGLGC